MGRLVARRPALCTTKNAAARAPRCCPLARGMQPRPHRSSAGEHRTAAAENGPSALGRAAAEVAAHWCSDRARMRTATRCRPRGNATAPSTARAHRWEESQRQCAAHLGCRGRAEQRGQHEQRLRWTPAHDDRHRRRGRRRAPTPQWATASTTLRRSAPRRRWRNVSRRFYITRRGALPHPRRRAACGGDGANDLNEYETVA